MTQALVLDGHDLARDLYAFVRELHTLLRDMDPARWRDELEQVFRDRLAEVTAGIQRLMDALESSTGLESVRGKLAELAALIEEHTPSADLPAARLRKEWNALRKRMQAEYEALAQQLKPFDIHAPSLRPTNYARNVLHVSGGLLAAWLILEVLTPVSMLLVAVVATSFAWTLELSRRRSARVNALCMKVLGRVAHPHEAHRINSSTWYLTSLTVLALTSSPLACAMAVLILGVADPAAAVVGRRFGRTKLVNGRSLEGTLAFVVAGATAGLAMLRVFFPELGWGLSLALAFGGAVPAAITELYSRRVDDNFSIPLAVAAGTGLILLGVG